MVCPVCSRFGSSEPGLHTQTWKEACKIFSVSLVSPSQGWKIVFLSGFTMGGIVAGIVYPGEYVTA